MKNPIFPVGTRSVAAYLGRGRKRDETADDAEGRAV
jgi:hypothetical protein